MQGEMLDCRRGAHDFWEPKLTHTEENAGQTGVKLPQFHNPLTLFTPALAGAGADLSSVRGSHLMFASGSGSGGGYDDDDYDFDDTHIDEDLPEPPAQRPQSNRTKRSAARGGNGGRSRTASSGTEARYLTDYLRIALPVIGIVLMLGLLWVWASHLLGSTSPDDGSDTTIGLVATETPEGNTINTEPGPSTPPSTQPAQNAGEIPIANQPVPTKPPFNPSQPKTPESGGDNQTGDGNTIALDSRVEITDEVNVRPSAGTSGDPKRQAEKGEEATVISGPEDADGFTWWELVFDDGSSGFVAEDFLKLVP